MPEQVVLRVKEESMSLYLEDGSGELLKKVQTESAKTVSAIKRLGRVPVVDELLDSTIRLMCQLLKMNDSYEPIIELGRAADEQMQMAAEGKISDDSFLFWSALQDRVNETTRFLELAEVESPRQQLAISILKKRGLYGL